MPFLTKKTGVCRGQCADTAHCEQSDGAAWEEDEYRPSKNVAGLDGLGLPASLDAGTAAETLRQCRVREWMDDAVAKPSAADLRRAVGLQRALCAGDGAGGGAARAGRWWRLRHVSAPASEFHSVC